MSMVSHGTSFQVIEKDVNSDNKHVLHGANTPALYSRGKWYLKLPDILNEVLSRYPTSNSEHALNVTEKQQKNGFR